MSDPNFLEMSDDEISNVTLIPDPQPEVHDESLAQEQTDGLGGADPAPSGSADDGAAADLDRGDHEEGDEPSPLEQPDDQLGAKPRDEKGRFAKTDGKPGDTPADKPAGDAVKPPAEGGEQAPESTPADFDYKAAYEALQAQLTTSFKANGKTISPQSPEELIKMAQLGLNYGKKMQALAPNLKVMRMLENAKLLDENQVNFMIDLVGKKDKGAIQKFLKDNSIDPMELDTQNDPGYTPGNHRVSDSQMRFQETLTDVMSNQNGRETVRELESTWDEASLAQIAKTPSTLKLIASQRETGIYQQISREVERLRLLEVIPPETPFLDAYKHVGTQLHNAGRLLQNGVPTNQAQVPQGQPPKPQTQPPKVLDRRVDAPKPQVTNGDKARAAAPTRTSPPRKNPDFNPLALSDEEFSKQTSFRL
jgi:hypothetical protein